MDKRQIANTVSGASCAAGVSFIGIAIVNGITWLALIGWTVLVMGLTGFGMLWFTAPKKDDPAEAKRFRDTKIEAVAAFLEEGQAIRKAFSDHGDVQAIIADRTSWTGRVSQYLTENLGRAEEARFRAARGDGSGMHGRNEVGNANWADIQGKCNVLTDILRELGQPA